MRWHIFNHHCIGAYSSAIANNNISDDLTASAQENVVSNCRRTSLFGPDSNLMFHSDIDAAAD
jgi:hypothetical protein